MTISGPDGAYSFGKLAAGTYTIQETLPQAYLDGIDTAGTVAGTASGTAGSGMISGIVLGSDQVGTEFNFGHRGMLLKYISKSLFLASTPAGATLVQQYDPAPVVALNGAAGRDYSTSFSAGGGAVPVVNASAATITKSDGGWLGSLIVTIANPQDGASETSRPIPPYWAAIRRLVPAMPAACSRSPAWLPRPITRPCCAR